MLAAALALAMQGIQIYRDHQQATNGTGKATPGADLALKAVALYRQSRDQALAAGTVAPDDPSVKSDAELIDLFAHDAIVFRDHAAALLAKYALPPAPVAPPALPPTT